MAVTRRRSRSRSPAKRSQSRRRRRSPSKARRSAAPNVVQAITALGNRNGSSAAAIVKQVSGGRATAAVRRRVAAGLKRAVASGTIQRTRGGYRIAAAKVSFELLL